MTEQVGEFRIIVLSLLRRKPLYLFGVTVTSIYLIYSLIVGIHPGIIGYNPTQLNLSEAFHAPSWKYPFGTDNLGRSVLLEVMYGAPIDAGGSIAIVLFAFSVGVLTGALAGYVGGLVDDVIMRTADVFFAFPSLVLAAAIAAALGPGMLNASIAIAAVRWPVFTRIARGETLTVKQHQFIMAARASGLSEMQMVVTHIIPNVVTPMIAYATADVGNVIIWFAVLSYLGLGSQPPHFDLGTIVFNGQDYVQLAPWYPIAPGIIIFIIVISFAFVGDMINDLLNPKTRR